MWIGPTGVGAGLGFLGASVLGLQGDGQCADNCRKKFTGSCGICGICFNIKIVPFNISGEIAKAILSLMVCFGLKFARLIYLQPCTAYCSVLFHHM